MTMLLYELDELPCQQPPLIKYARKCLSFLRSRWIMEKTVAEYLDQLEYGDISQDGDTGKITIDTQGVELIGLAEGEVFHGEAILRPTLEFNNFGFTLQVYSSLKASAMPEGLGADAAIKNDLGAFNKSLANDEKGLKKYIGYLPNKEQFYIDGHCLVFGDVITGDGDYLDRKIMIFYKYRV